MSVDSAKEAPRASTDDRLSVARDLLARANDRGLGGRRGGAPASSSAGVLPVAAALAGLFPGGGLPRGAAIGLGESPSSTSLLFALLAEASTAGSWCAAVGLPELGAVAASEAGVDLSRLALVPSPGDQLMGVVAALLEGLEIVAVAGCQRLHPKQRQALAARAKARGAVLLAMDAWPGADFRLAVRADASAGYGGWTGLAADGHGRLRQRQVHLRATGHGLPHRGRTARALLPGPSGSLCAVDYQHLAGRPASRARGRAS
jgi:hypothetical protein